MKESAFQAKVLKYLRGRGGHWIKIHVSAYQSEGEPDIIGVYRGRFFAFELKQGSYQTTEMQKYKLKKIRDNGGIAMEIRDMEQVQTILDEIDACPNARV